jgi:hypothetical protein
LAYTLLTHIRQTEQRFRGLLLQIGLDKLSKLIVAMQKLYRWLNSRTSVEVERDRYARLGSDRYARPRSRR